MFHHRSHHRALSLLALSATVASTGLPCPVHAQGRAGAARTATPVNQSADPVLRPFTFRPIGPAVMMGRVDDITGPDNDVMVMYAGFATGGVWKTQDGGAHWRPVFDQQPNQSIGAIGVAATNADIVYVGTGEANNRQSSTIGDGMWGSTDGGEHWTHLGLEKTQTIGRIVVDPTNPNVVYVAAVGHLFGPNEERGLYKTTDGGKTWKKVKYVDENTGFTDVAIDPVNPKVLYAASYERRRTWFGFNGAGPGSALWKTTDAGATWKKLEGPGWPKPKDGAYGRMAIAIFRARPSTLYVQVEAGISAALNSATMADGTLWTGGINSSMPGGTETASRPGAPQDPNASGVFRSDDGGATWKFASNQNQRPLYFSRIVVDPVSADKVIVGGESAEISLDGAKTWQTLQGSHADYHAIWISPKDPRIVAVGNDGGINTSNNGGVTWLLHNTIGPLGQFYHLSADMRRPYWVCGGLQDNNSWCGPSALRSAGGPSNADWFTVAGGDGYYTRQDPTDWATVYGGSQWGQVDRVDLRDGTAKPVSPVAPGGGGRGGMANVINAPATITNKNLRYHSNSPFVMSPHNPAELYAGAQYFFKSADRGDSWWVNPNDLTKQLNRFGPDFSILGVPGNAPMEEKNDGISTNSDITMIAESPARPGVIWVGTDDGNLQLSMDGGEHFTNVAANITGAPKGYVYVNRIEPSHFEPGTCYVGLDNHRNDDWKPYLFKTTDYGKTWTSVSSNLPVMGPITAIAEDVENPDLLFVGTEWSLFVTLDGGRSWRKFMNGVPNVPVYDLLIHPRDRDLIIATHGRSLWIADDITALEQFGRVGDKDLVLFDPRPAVEWQNRYADFRSTEQDWRGENPQGGSTISVYSKAERGPGKLEFLERGQVVSTMDVTVVAGMNRYQWNMQRVAVAGGGGRGGRGGRGRGGDGSGGVPFVAGGRGGGGSLVAPGAYTVRLTVGDTKLETSVVVRADIWMQASR